MEKHTFAKVHKKASFGASSYEGSLFIGSLELLAVGGAVIDNQRDSACFLGSFIKPLISLMTHATSTLSHQVWTASTSTEAMTSERLLRQHYKVHAGKKWSLHMKSFFDLGFFPVNPLRVKDHPLVNDCPSMIYHSAIFRVCALRSQNDVHLKKLLDILKKTTFMKNNVDRRKGVHTFGSMNEAVEGTGMWKLVIETLAAIKKAEPDMFKDDKATVVKNKKLLLALADAGFFASLSRKNEQIIKATTSYF